MAVKRPFRVKHRIIKTQGSTFLCYSNVFLEQTKRASKRGSRRERPIKTGRNERTIALSRNRVRVASHAFDRSGSEVPTLPPESSLNYLSAQSHKHTPFGKCPLHTHPGPITLLHCSIFKTLLWDSAN